MLLKIWIFNLVQELRSYTKNMKLTPHPSFLKTLTAPTYLSDLKE
jgi:hypothetical protein